MTPRKPQDSRRLYGKANLRSQTQKIDLKRLIKHACENFPKIDKRIVEIGVLYTMLQRNGSEDPIRSARYFDPEIRKMAKEGPKGNKAIDALLQRRREQWEGYGK